MDKSLLYIIGTLVLALFGGYKYYMYKYGKTLFELMKSRDDAANQLLLSEIKRAKEECERLEAERKKLEDEYRNS
jgi:hypothetical protein